MRYFPALRGVTLGEGGLKKAEQSPAPMANGLLFEGAGARSATEGVISENLLNLALQQETPSVTAIGRATALQPDPSAACGGISPHCGESPSRREA